MTLYTKNFIFFCFMAVMSAGCLSFGGSKTGMFTGILFGYLALFSIVVLMGRG